MIPLIIVKNQLLSRKSWVKFILYLSNFYLFKKRLIEHRLKKKQLKLCLETSWSPAHCSTIYLTSDYYRHNLTPAHKWSVSKDNQDMNRNYLKSLTPDSCSTNSTISQVWRQTEHFQSNLLVFWRNFRKCCLFHQFLVPTPSFPK